VHDRVKIIIKLAFQNNEKEKRADGVRHYKQRTAFETKKKEKRATELSIANIELAFKIMRKKSCAS
jgi:hypothetical protein